MNKNKIAIIVSIIFTMVLLIGGTYALINFLTDSTSVTMLVGGDRISFNAGTNITAEGLVPTYSMYSDTNVITKDIEIYKENGDYTAGINLYLNLKTWPSAMSSSSFRWALYKNGDYLSSGNFSGKSQGSNLKLTSNTQAINLVENKDTYKLYMWIDAYQESNINMMNQSFTVNLYGQVSFYDSGIDPIVNEKQPNHPDLADGMIPIKYNYVLDEWVKADESNIKNDWYDYYNKMWANAVTVTTESREEYMNADVGTTVNEDDILAYYVWIPRYKYVLFNTSFEAISPVEIQIEFQSVDDEIFEGSENGQYLTHPAFWWDNNSNDVRKEGEELAGIWVGKFETTGTDDNPTIKPNVLPIVGIYSNTTWFEIQNKFNKINYLTDIGTNESDSHMMKNLDWGAVAYLSHSRYGKNSEVSGTYNNDYKTGIASNYTYNGFYINEGKITANKNAGMGIGSSTTGNVYGIYGMSAGVSDMVAAFKSSSFEKKYVDIYELRYNANDFSTSKLGDALGETRGWYGDQLGLYSNSQWYNWFIRGHLGKTYSLYAGIFAGETTPKPDSGDVGSRAVLILP